MSSKKTLQVLTLGCSKNTVDTEHLLWQVNGHFDIVPPEDRDRHVDFLLLNTCSFIADAKEESIGAILSAVQRKESGEVGKVFVFGCLSQRYESEMPELIPEVDAWFGARDFDPVVLALGVEPERSRDTGRVFTEPRKGSAYLKISEGCDRRCSYCAIPFIRGAHRSVPMEDLVTETRFLAERGVKELIIIAQDITCYGIDLYHRRCLGDLLRRLSEVDGIEWIRLHYAYPTGFPEDVLDLMAENPKICPYLDIPLQHISDPVLDKMHRNCTGDSTRAFIAKVREKIPDIVLRTTVIVGHPGEGEDEFDELLSFAREARFERLGAFTYSEEEGTYGAGHYRNEVPEEVKQYRYSALMSLQGGISLEFNRSRVGTAERVIVDSVSDDVLVCRSRYESPDVDGEILVRYEPGLFGGKSAEDLCGTFIHVKIVGADEYDLIAEPL